MTRKKLTERRARLGARRKPTRPKGPRPRTRSPRRAAKALRDEAPDRIRDLDVHWVDIDSLKPNPQNSRTHTDKQVDQIAASIAAFGFTNPLLVDEGNQIMAGHGRWRAAKRAGYKAVPVIPIDDLSEDQKRAYVIADNRIAELAEWDEEILSVELRYLSEIDMDFEIEITGFETPEIDILIEQQTGIDQPDEADQIPELEADGPPVSQLGDLWLMGEHRILCADALDPDSYSVLMDGGQAQMVFTDPPYNVPIDGHVGGLGRIKHGDFVMASGELTGAKFIAFLATALTNLANACADGALIYAFIDWRHLGELLRAGRDVGLDLLNLCVWSKTNAGMGSLYRSQHELVLVFKCGTASHINNIELGKHGRHRTNVWNYAGVNTFKRGRLEELSMHPTVKPVALVADAIKDCTRRGQIVLDGFCGSGTTIIAAERTGRIAYALELDPKFVDVAVRRWQRRSGGAAVHAETGLVFDEMAERRGEAHRERSRSGIARRKTKEVADES